MSDSAEKTEQPTERRRQQARQQGNIARSVDVTAAVVLLAAAGGLYFFGPSCGETFIRLMRGTLQGDALTTLDRSSAVALIWSLAFTTAAAVLPVMLLVMVGSLAASLAQTGFLWSTEALQPKWERINPLSGFQRLFSLQAAMRLVGSLIKITAVAAVAYSYLTAHQDEFQSLAQQDLPILLVTAGRSFCELGFSLAITLVALAILDYGYQWWQHERDLRMSKQELREEMKSMDGDPHIRARRREAHRKLAEARDLSEVPNADAVIVNPIHIAIAIKYEPGKMPAPIVVAKGKDEVAEQIKKIALAHHVPIIERTSLARSLYKSVKVGHPIPPDMYDVFVEILAYVYRLSGKKVV
ncbi:MAG TPA: flagellar biosynthesis protein FlhB [Planctomycetaceae bacterium]|nr:flagellar biosynthesis protein FlhB [Planctomycetaceae bacterium]